MQGDRFFGDTPASPSCPRFSSPTLWPAITPLRRGDGRTDTISRDFMANLMALRLDLQPDGARLPLHGHAGGGGGVGQGQGLARVGEHPRVEEGVDVAVAAGRPADQAGMAFPVQADRKSTRLNSSHHSTSYAVFCLK